MKIGIIGTGAMGSIYAARLARAGHSVFAIDQNQEHISAINERGLTITGPEGTFCTRDVIATSDISMTRDCALIIIATKLAGVAPVARALSSLMNSNARVLTIQNGLGSAEALMQSVPSHRILLGVAEGFGASLDHAGQVSHKAMKQIRLGALEKETFLGMDDIAQVWRSGGFDVEIFENIEQLIWEKLLCNVTLSGPCTVFDVNVADLLKTDAQWKIALGAMTEAYQLGLAKGIPFSFDDPVPFVTDFARRVGTAKPSMLQDHQAQRRSEIHAINGAIARLGREMGYETPYNTTLSEIILAHEAKFKD